MASEMLSTDRQPFTCGICIENYNTPRYLPTCGHTFCENCLFTYVTNLQQQGSKLYCPICRKTLNVPENTQVTLEWIQTFPLNSVIIKTAEEIRRECDPCKEQGETTVGLNFCMDCHEVYCKTCTNSHKAFKITRHHRLIDTRELFFSSFIKCPNHSGSDAECYCKDHDGVFCLHCFNSTHTQCNTCIVSNHTNDADLFREKTQVLMSEMINIVNYLNLLKTIRENIKKDLKDNMKEIRERVEEIRDQVVTLMDNVVSHVSDVTQQIELENEDRLDMDISRVSKIKEQTEEKISLLDTIRQHGSERHQFISAHLMKTQVEEIRRKIYEEDKDLTNINAKLTVADDISKLLESTDVDKLVQVTVSESSHTDLDAASNYLRDSTLVRIEEHTVRPNAGHDPCYYGVSIHKDGRVILSDNCSVRSCGYICLYNPTNRTMLKLKLNCPYSATQIDDTHIAVSIPGDETISIVTVENELRVEKTLNTQYILRSIVALNNGQLAVVWMNPPAFSIIDISGTEIVQKSYFDQDKSGRRFKSFTHLAVDEKRHHVIQPCNKDKAVYCFNFTGEPVFRYTNPELIHPTGVALDKCGNIYVCEYWKGSIHKLSPTGELITIITEGVPSFPLDICCDNTGTGFWVTHFLSSYDKIVYFRLEQNTET